MDKPQFKVILAYLLSYCTLLFFIPMEGLPGRMWGAKYAILILALLAAIVFHLYRSDNLSFGIGLCVLGLAQFNFVLFRLRSDGNAWPGLVYFLLAPILGVIAGLGLLMLISKPLFDLEYGDSSTKSIKNITFSLGTAAVLAALVFGIETLFLSGGADMEGQGLPSHHGGYIMASAVAAQYDSIEGAFLYLMQCIELIFIAGAATAVLTLLSPEFRTAAEDAYCELSDFFRELTNTISKG